MNFNGINNINIKTPGVNNTDDIAKCKNAADNAPCAQKDITAQTPNSPKYWQAQQGVNFCGKNKDKKSKIGSFIDKHAAKLYYHKLVYQHVYRDEDKENLKKLIPMGCKAMDTYCILVPCFTTPLADNEHHITSEEFTQKSILAGDMIDFAPELLFVKKEFILDILAYNNRKDLINNRFDTKREIFQNIIKNKDASIEEKLWWLHNSVVPNVYKRNDLDDYKTKTVEHFADYIKTEDETEKLSVFLKDFNISDKTTDKIKQFILDEKITAQDIIDIAVLSADEDFYDDNLDKNLSEILNIIDEKPYAAGHLRNLANISKDERKTNNSTMQLNSRLLKEELKKESLQQDIKTIDFITKNVKYNHYFANNEDYLDFISSIDENNFQDFKDLCEKEDIKLAQAIDIARYCKDENGKFKLYPGQKECLSELLNSKKSSWMHKRVFPVLCAKYVKDDENGLKYFDKEGFSTITNAFAYDMNFFELIDTLGEKNFANLLSGEDFGINQANLKKTFAIYNSISLIKEALENEPDYQEKFTFLDKALADIEFRLDFEDIFLPVDNKDIKAFAKNILTSKDGALSEFETIITKAIPLLKTFDKGLPLEYPREDFLYDLEKICNTKEKLEILSSKTGIKIIGDNNGENSTIKGYDGIMLLDKLNKDDPLECKIYNLAHRFFYENKINTGNEDLDKNLNIIIKAFPEFINIIGKKQHSTHNYTLDIHSLLVLANSIKHPDYKNLKATNKSILKNAAIFHDISKAQNEVDEDHQYLSAIYSKGILKKFTKNPEMIERLSEFIKNHHWLKDYQTAEDKSKAVKEVAFKFRRSGDFDAAKIMAHADLISVSEEFYNDYKDALNDKNLKEIENRIKEFNSKGCCIFSDYFIAPKALDNYIQNYKGREYKVIDFHKISKDEDLAKYGFTPKRHKDDVNFLVHMVSDENCKNDLANVKRLASAINEGCLSVSLINPNHARTYDNRKYGVILSTSNNNVINIDYENQGSGCKKGLSDALRLIYNEGLARNNFKENILNILGIKNVSDEEYAKFYKECLAEKNSIAHFKPDKEYEIGTNKIKGRDLINAINEFQNSLIDKTGKKHNEIVCYTPKIRAIIAKERSVSKMPDEVLNFAYENKLPIVLI